MGNASENKGGESNEKLEHIEIEITNDENSQFSEDLERLFSDPNYKVFDLGVNIGETQNTEALKKTN